VHSGFGHILLKTGFVGLFIFIGIFLTYVINVKKGWRLLLPEYKALAVGCLCGFAAQMPNMFTGPPVIEVRTMLLSGFLFAIPLICIEIARRKIKKNQGDEIKLANESVAFAHTIPSVKLRKNK
jgi:hypothetical protein